MLRTFFSVGGMFSRSSLQVHVPRQTVLRQPNRFLFIFFPGRVLGLLLTGPFGAVDRGPPGFVFAVSTPHLLIKN